MRYTVVKQVRNSRKRDYGSENDYAEAYIRVFIKYFRDTIRVPRIKEIRVPTGPYRVPNISLKKNLRYILFVLQPST